MPWRPTALVSRLTARPMDSTAFGASGPFGRKGFHMSGWCLVPGHPYPPGSTPSCDWSVKVTRSPQSSDLETDEPHRCKDFCEAIAGCETFSVLCTCQEYGFLNGKPEVAKGIRGHLRSSFEHCPTVPRLSSPNAEPSQKNAF